MEFPTSKLSLATAGPSIGVKRPGIADTPHPFRGRQPDRAVRGDSGGPCRDCQGGWSSFVHLMPLGGWQ